MQPLLLYVHTLYYLYFFLYFNILQYITFILETFVRSFMSYIIGFEKNCLSNFSEIWRWTFRIKRIIFVGYVQHHIANCSEENVLTVNNKEYISLEKAKHPFPPSVIPESFGAAELLSAALGTTVLWVISHCIVYISSQNCRQELCCSKSPLN